MNESAETVQSPEPRSEPVRGMGLTEASRKLADRWAAKAAEEAAPEADTPDAAIPEPAPEAAPVEQEAGTEPAQEAQDAPDEQVTETDPEPASAETEIERLTVDDLARDYGLDKNLLMQKVKHTVTTADGASKEVGLHELVMGYQRGDEHRAAMEALDRARTQFEADTAQKRQVLDATAQQLAASSAITDQMFEQEEQSIHARYQHTDWARLRGSDPGEYSARWTEYQSALNGVASRRQEAQQQHQRAIAEYSAQAQATRQEMAEKALKEVTRYIPEWSDAERMQADASDMTTYLTGELGLTDDELAFFNMDARLYRLAYDSMQLQRIKAKTDEVRQQPARQVAKPGQQATPRVARFRQQRQREDQARERLRQTGRQEDAARALTERWRNR